MTPTSESIRLERLTPFAWLVIGVVSLTVIYTVIQMVSFDPTSGPLARASRSRVTRQRTFHSSPGRRKFFASTPFRQKSHAWQPVVRLKRPASGWVIDFSRKSVWTSAVGCGSTRGWIRRPDVSRRGEISIGRVFAARWSGK
jgi:hypothetical protein